MCFLYFFCIYQTDLYEWHVLGRFWPALDCLTYQPQVCCYTEMLIKKLQNSAVLSLKFIKSSVFNVLATDPFSVTVFLRVQKKTTNISAVVVTLSRAFSSHWPTWGHGSIFPSCSLWPGSTCLPYICTIPNFASTLKMEEAASSETLLNYLF